MANPTGGFGLQVVRSFNNSAGNYQLTHRQILYSDANSIGFGDAVLPTTGGYVTCMSGATLSTLISGVFYGCQYFNTATKQYNWSNYWPGIALSTTLSTVIPTVDAYIVEDPRTVFAIRGSSGNINSTSIGLNFNLSTASSTVNVAGFSQATLASSSGAGAVTASLPFRLVGLSNRIGNDNTLANNVVEVVMNTAAIAVTTGN